MFETVVTNTQALEADLVTTGDMCLECQYLEAEAGESAGYRATRFCLKNRTLETEPSCRPLTLSPFLFVPLASHLTQEPTPDTAE